MSLEVVATEMAIYTGKAKHLALSYTINDCTPATTQPAYQTEATLPFSHPGMFVQYKLKSAAPYDLLGNVYPMLLHLPNT